MSGKFVFLSQFYVNFRKVTLTTEYPFKQKILGDNATQQEKFHEPVIRDDHILTSITVLTSVYHPGNSQSLCSPTESPVCDVLCHVEWCRTFFVRGIGALHNRHPQSDGDKPTCNYCHLKQVVWFVLSMKYVLLTPNIRDLT